MAVSKCVTLQPGLPPFVFQLSSFTFHCTPTCEVIQSQCVSCTFVDSGTNVFSVRVDITVRVIQKPIPTLMEYDIFERFHFVPQTALFNEHLLNRTAAASG